MKLTKSRIRSSARFVAGRLLKNSITNGYDLDISELVKVVVESKCHFNLELFHDDFASAVGEAPILVVELLKCFPRKCQIRGSNLVYFRKTIMKEPCAQQ